MLSRFDIIKTSSKVEEVLQILRAEELEDARQRLELDVQKGKQA